MEIPAQAVAPRVQIGFAGTPDGKKAAMTFPLWIPWVFTLALAWPLLMRLDKDQDHPTRLWWVPALAMLVVSASMSLDGRRATQDELMTATHAVTGAIEGSLGPVGDDRVKYAIEGELGHEVWVSSSGPMVKNPREASYLIDVWTSQNGDGPSACVEVAMVLLSTAPELGLASLDAESGRCETDA